MRKHMPKGPEGHKKDRSRRNHDRRRTGKRRIRTLERYRDGRAYTGETQTTKTEGAR